MSVLRLFCFVVLLGLLFPAVTCAQEADPEATHSLRDDVWALQFSVGSNFTLGSFQGSTISAKHHYAPGRALRYGLRLNGQHRVENPDERADVRRSAVNVGLDIQYIVYPTLRRDPGGALQLFYGLGPEVGGGVNYIDVDGGPERTQGNVGVGVGGVLGAEWFVRERISLLAEYRTTLAYRYLILDGGGNGHEIDLSSGGGYLGVSIYF